MRALFRGAGESQAQLVHERIDPAGTRELCGYDRLLSCRQERRDRDVGVAAVEDIVLDEAVDLCFRRFAQEIRLMLKDVYVQCIIGANCSEDVLENMEKILTMDLSKREVAWIHKKAAEAYYRTNDTDNAIRVLKHAFHINPGLTGAKKISKKLGIENEVPK